MTRASSPYAVTRACTACGACLLTCPEHAIVVGLPLQVRADRCTRCGECVEVCPADAIIELRADVPTRADHGVVARPGDDLRVAAVPHLHDRGQVAVAAGRTGRPGATSTGALEGAAAQGGAAAQEGAAVKEGAAAQGGPR